MTATSTVAPCFSRSQLLTWGVRRLVEAAKRQQYSGIWISVEEIEAVLSCIPREIRSSADLVITSAPKPPSTAPSTTR